MQLILFMSTTILLRRLLQCSHTVGWAMWPVKMVTEMTYCVSDGTSVAHFKVRGAHVRRKSPKIFFVLLCHSIFLRVQVQLIVLVSAFVMVSRSTVWSVSCLLFFYSRSHPPSQRFIKVGSRCWWPMESAPLFAHS